MDFDFFIILWSKLIDYNPPGAGELILSEKLWKTPKNGEKIIFEFGGRPRGGPRLIFQKICSGAAPKFHFLIGALHSVNGTLKNDPPRMNQCKIQFHMGNILHVCTFDPYFAF